jgi:hypothetical protein
MLKLLQETEFLHFADHCSLEFLYELDVPRDSVFDNLQETRLFWIDNFLTKMECVGLLCFIVLPKAKDWSIENEFETVVDLSRRSHGNRLLRARKKVWKTSVRTENPWSRFEPSASSVQVYMVFSFELAGWDFGYCGHYWAIVPSPDDM